MQVSVSQELRVLITLGDIHLPLKSSGLRQNFIFYGLPVAAGFQPFAQSKIVTVQPFLEWDADFPDKRRLKTKIRSIMLICVPIFLRVGECLPKIFAILDNNIIGFQIVKSQFKIINTGFNIVNRYDTNIKSRMIVRLHSKTSLGEGIPPKKSRAHRGMSTR